MARVSAELFDGHGFAPTMAPVEDGRLVRVGHRLLPLDGFTLGAMTPTPPEQLRTDPAAARERLARDGYLLLRGVLPAAAVERACAATCAVLAEAGYRSVGEAEVCRLWVLSG